MVAQALIISSRYWRSSEGLMVKEVLPNFASARRISFWNKTIMIRMIELRKPLRTQLRV